MRAGSMRMLCALLLATMAAPAMAETVVVSPAPLSTSVTVYRDPDRSEGGRIDPRWPNGYALISEKRRISLPAGESTIRFEGVAGGMIAVSAVVSGLPGGISEKNRDARLLSPAALLDGSLGNRVHIRRTSRQTGKTNELDAIIRSGPDNAVVLETVEGIEALRCSGLPETLIYDAVPDGLTAKPSFTVHTITPAGTQADVMLTYLATGFDWGASYVAKVAEDGKTLDLFAWLAVANGNDVIYPDAQLLAVAGEPRKESDLDVLVAQTPSPTLNLKCWPMDSTSTHPTWGQPTTPPPPIMEMAVMAPAPAMMKSADIAVTAGRIARQEELGDLKLYRVPMPVDVAPNGQKQVALLQKQNVPFTRLYGATISPWTDSLSRPLDIKLRMQNKTKDGLGLPLPLGGIVVLQRTSEDELLLADSRMRDHAIGEKVEIDAGTSNQFLLEQMTLQATDKERRIRLMLSNALARSAPAEIMIKRVDGWELSKPSAKLTPKDGNRLWALNVPANGTASLEFSLRRQ